MKSPFIPFVQKGRFEEDEGYLILYEDLCKALKVPNDHWLIAMEDGDPYMTLELLPKRNIAFKNGLMHVRHKKNLNVLGRKEMSISTLRHKDALSERCGIPVTHFEAYPMLRSQGNAYHALNDFPCIYLYARLKDVYFWFHENPFVHIEKIEIKKTAWERR
jgi:hypothetical protein